jgi:CelD/BcsL family acetyltransferase involved in cellulose biosynthesis
MRAQIHTSAEFPSRLRAEWMRLAAGDPTAGPQWRSAWWEAYGTGLETAVGVVYREDAIVALAPWYVARRGWLGRSLSAMGDGKACTDYQRVLFDRSLSEAETVAAVECLVEAYRRESATARVTAWILEGVDPSDASIALLGERLVERGFEPTEESLESSWVLELPRTWEAFVGGVHRTLRRKINKAARRVEQGEVRFETATTRQAIDEAWDDFVRLHGLRFRDRDEAGGCFADPRFNDFLRGAVLGLAEQGAAELVWCRAENAIVSMQLHLQGGGTSSMYQSGLDPAQMQLEPGHLLYTHVVRRLIERGFERLDFLRGDEPYKADWGAKPRPLARLTCVAPRVSARLRYQAMLSLRRLKRRFAANHVAPETAPSNSTSPDAADNAEQTNQPANCS